MKFSLYYYDKTTYEIRVLFETWLKLLTALVFFEIRTNDGNS